jgi:hypothetical protein
LLSLMHGTMNLKFSVPVQIEPETHLATCKIGTCVLSLE